jgi:hypothetical protein
LPSGDKTIGIGRLLFGDSLIVVLLLNHVRHSVVAWLFGASEEARTW